MYISREIGKSCIQVEKYMCIQIERVDKVCVQIEKIDKICIEKQAIVYINIKTDLHIDREVGKISIQIEKEIKHLDRDQIQKQETREAEKRKVTKRNNNKKKYGVNRCTATGQKTEIDRRDRNRQERRKQTGGKRTDVLESVSACQICEKKITLSRVSRQRRLGGEYSRGLILAVIGDRGFICVRGIGFFV